MKQFLLRSLASTFVTALTGCMAVTTIGSGQPDVVISIQDKSYRKMPVTDEFAQTTFDNYEFQATKPGRQPFYGILPLRFNRGFLIMDILLFAPLTLFNLRQVYPYYQFEIEKRVLLFKDKEGDDWQEFRPTQAEAARARDYFRGR
jgi:hypothetical protein